MCVCVLHVQSSAIEKLSSTELPTQSGSWLPVASLTKLLGGEATPQRPCDTHSQHIVI